MARPPYLISPEERALWARVIATVTPLVKEKPIAAAADPVPSPSRAIARAGAGNAGLKPASIDRSQPKTPTPVRSAKAPSTTLDASWDRRLARGLVSPESSIDLHGHTLAGAHDLLDRGLNAAIMRGDRVLLLITGKPPRPESERPHARGAIRAAVGDWLSSSRHADRIAAVRNAHPRHGGQGALYIVLRRERSSARQEF